MSKSAPELDSRQRRKLARAEWLLKSGALVQPGCAASTDNTMTLANWELPTAALESDWVSVALRPPPLMYHGLTY